MRLGDPLLEVLKNYAPSVTLGPGRSRQFDKDAFMRDLGAALERNTLRFKLVLAILVAGFVVVLAIMYFNPALIHPVWLFGGSGAYFAGLGTLLLQLNRSWWRTDTLLTVAKYAGTEEISLIIRSLLNEELKSDKAIKAASPPKKGK